MPTAPIVLVPGFWLGAWAWDEVAAALRADGHDVIAVTLPGLESADADRSAITMSDHVDAICEAVRTTGAPVVLAVHSGAGVSGYGASDRVPEQIAAMVFVDSGPATGALDPDLSAVEVALPTWEELDGGRPPGASIGLRLRNRGAVGGRRGSAPAVQRSSVTRGASEPRAGAVVT